MKYLAHETATARLVVEAGSTERTTTLLWSATKSGTTVHLAPSLRGRLVYLDEAVCLSEQRANTKPNEAKGDDKTLETNSP